MLVVLLHVMRNVGQTTANEVNGFVIRVYLQTLRFVKAFLRKRVTFN